MDHPDTSGAFGADSFLSIADAAYKQSEIFQPVRHYGTRPMLSSNFYRRQSILSILEYRGQSPVLIIPPMDSSITIFLRAYHTKPRSCLRASA
jgi:hypothetical protein